tara:strand:- start:477 stop:1358 length:882 start_codon:yes stop_codon:yes gene_type:complete
MSLKLGIIGGSGLYDLELEKQKKIAVEEGPFGKPSSDIFSGVVNDIEIFFLPRHGKNHIFSPSAVPYRANIEILKKLGCNDIISISAVGSLREDLPPGTFILVDQYIDRTFARVNTFFDKNIVAHVSMAEPTCKKTAELIIKAAESVKVDILKGGTYLVMEGPQFSSVAESKLYREWGCDVIGMTNMPEAKLAREAEIRYVPIAMVTDYDCWRENEENVNVEEIVKTLEMNASKAKLLLKSFINEFTNSRPNYVIDGIDNALDTAIISSNFTREDLINAGLGTIASRILNACK